MLICNKTIRQNHENTLKQWVTLYYQEKLKQAKKPQLLNNFNEHSPVIGKVLLLSNLYIRYLFPLIQREN